MQRLNYIDTVKGLAITSIILLHFENGLFPTQMNLFISAYMITMFYVTAGWIDAMHDCQRPFREFVNRRWRQLMVPYIWWTVIILVFDCVLWCFHYYDTYFIFREAYKSVTLRGIGTLWFLPALFGGSLLWYYTRKVNKWYVFVAVLCVVLIYQQIYQEVFAVRTDSIGRIIDSPFRAVNAMGNAWIGIGAGFFFYQACCRVADKPVFISGIVLCAISYVIETKLSLPSYLWTLSAPLLSPLGLILITKSMDSKKNMDRIFYPFTYCGKHSMVLMVTHYSIILVLCKMINGLITGSEELTGWLSICWFLIAMAAEYPLISLIEKKAPKIIGKK